MGMGHKGYSKMTPVNSKKGNGLRDCSRNPLILAEWTGLEPATPGVTGRV